MEAGRLAEAGNTLDHMPQHIVPGGTSQALHVSQHPSAWTLGPGPHRVFEAELGNPYSIEAWKALASGRNATDLVYKSFGYSSRPTIDAASITAQQADFMASVVNGTNKQTLTEFLQQMTAGMPRLAYPTLRAFPAPRVRLLRELGEAERKALMGGV